MKQLMHVENAEMLVLKVYAVIFWIDCINWKMT